MDKSVEHHITLPARDLWFTGRANDARGGMAGWAFTPTAAKCRTANGEATRHADRTAGSLPAQGAVVGAHRKRRGDRARRHAATRAARRGFPGRRENNALRIADAPRVLLGRERAAVGARAAVRGHDARRLHART